MIARIKGILSEIENNKGIIETSAGISYQAYLTPGIINRYPLLSEVSLYTHLQVREDALTLFAFESKEQYKFFILLLDVSGVGPKTAYNVISNSKTEELVQAIKNNNVDYFIQIPGLGKKTALKIMLEISQKIDKDFTFDSIYVSEDDKLVIDALTSLGIKSFEARKALSKISKQMSPEEKVKEALKLIR